MADASTIFLEHSTLGAAGVNLVRVIALMEVYFQSSSRWVGNPRSPNNCRASDRLWSSATTPTAGKELACACCASI